LQSARHGASALRAAIWIAIAAGITTVFGACQTSPLGRQQIVFYPQEEVAQMGAAAFARIQQETPLAQQPATEAYVQCIARELAAALPADQGPAQWQVELFAEESANAFALPGGEIGVHTGMVELAATPSQLATVVAHEIGHVIAEHTNERLSTAAVAEGGLTAVQVILGADTPAQQQLMGLLGLGAQVGVLLPFSRTQETEADLIGLELMARAGFDPRESIELWTRMAQQGNGAPPEFLSTHPSEASRIERLQAAMPEALPLYRSAIEAGRRPACTPPPT
jgi:predicted Zn-dependent protease